jgi:hypothetical protein
MLATLERILGVPVDAAFQDITFMIRREEIQAGLAALTRAADQNDLPDYSGLAPSLPIAPQDPEPDRSMHLQAFTPSTASSEDKSEKTAVNEEPIAAREEQIFVQTQPASYKLSTSKPHTSAPVGSEKSLVFRPIHLTKPPEDPREKDVLFTYGDTATPSSFGQKKAPRATRSVPANALQASES